MRIVSTIFLSLACNVALALPVTWTLNNVVFSDGGTGSGSFVYDADSNIFSGVDITTTAGSVLAGSEYHVANTDPNIFPGVATSSLLSFFLETQVDDDYFGEAIFFVILDGSMTNNGGVIQLNTNLNGEGICGFPDCVGPLDNQSRNLTSGFITAVPVPAPLLLLGSALLVLRRFRRSSSAQHTY